MQNDRNETKRAELAGLCRTHGKLLFGIAFGILRNADVAEECCQQAFLKAWERRGSIGNGGRLRGWLARVVMNESLLVLRRKRRERAVLDDPAWRCDGESSAAADPWLHGRITSALNNLPELTRIVVVLRVMQGISGNEVKQLLDCSASEVSRRLYSGMEQLRVLLASERSREVEVRR